MLQLLIPLIVGVLAPKAPAWVLGLLSDGIPAIFEIVETLQETDLVGAEKLELATRETGDALDEALDSIPAWSAIDEDRRDIIIEGLVELVVFIAIDAGGVDRPRKVRRDFRKMWRDAAGSR